MRYNVTVVYSNLLLKMFMPRAHLCCCWEIVVAVDVVVALIFNKHIGSSHRINIGQSNTGLYYTFEQIYERAVHISHERNGTLFSLSCCC